MERAGEAAPHWPYGLLCARAPPRLLTRMVKQWHFEQDDDEKWMWKRSELDEEFASERSFTEQIDCMLDAVRFVVRRRRGASDDSTND